MRKIGGFAAAGSSKISRKELSSTAEEGAVVVDHIEARIGFVPRIVGNYGEEVRSCLSPVDGLFRRILSHVKLRRGKDR